MKKIKLYIVFLLFVSTSAVAQKSEKLIQKEIQQLYAPYEQLKDSISALIKVSQQKFDLEKDSIRKEQISLYIDSLYNISDKADIDELTLSIAYYREHPYSFYVFYLIQDAVTRQKGKNFYADFESVYKLSPVQIKQSTEGKRMEKNLKYFKQSMVGSIAPNFKGKDVMNNPISLSEFISKKYVLLEFWASWCSPCIDEFPFLKKLQNEYGNDLVILAVSIDEDTVAWHKAINKLGLYSWKHFSVKKNNSLVKRDYFVFGIPHKVLINKQGLIIGKWKASGELNKRSIEALLAHELGNSSPR